MGEHRTPVLTGSVQKRENEENIQVATIGLWENESDNEKAPKFKGRMELGSMKDGKFVKSGEIRFVSLWPFKPRKGEEQTSTADF